MQEIKIIFSFHGRPFFLFISTHLKVSCQCDVILYIIPFSIVHQVRHTLLNYSETTFQFSIHHNYMQSYNAFHEVTQVNKFITYALIIQTMIKTESHCLLLSMATPSFTYCVVGISFRGQGYSQYLAGTSLFDFFLSLIFFPADFEMQERSFNRKAGILGPDNGPVTSQTYGPDESHLLLQLCEVFD